MNWRKGKWWILMIPYFIVILWTVAVTFFVAHNTAAIRAENSDQAVGICNSENTIKAVVSTVIKDDAKESTGATQEFWIKTFQQLDGKLTQENCKDPKVLYKIEAVDDGGKP